MRSTTRAGGNIRNGTRTQPALAEASSEPEIDKPRLIDPILVKMRGRQLTNL